MISSMESTIVPRRFFTTRVDWLGRWLGFVLVLCPALAGRCADGYLVRFGPPPLRFSTQFSQNKGFTWPTPLMLKPSVTNQVEIGGNPGALTNTLSSKATQIGLSPEVRPIEAQAPDLPRDSGAFVYPNSSTASNLLLIWRMGCRRRKSSGRWSAGGLGREVGAVHSYQSKGTWTRTT